MGYIKPIWSGIYAPSLPNGGWSITVEFHFYLMLPALLFLTRMWKFSLVLVLLTALLLRTLLYQQLGEIQTLSYWTIIGRIDQFLLGILAFQFRDQIKQQHLFVALTLILFAAFYWYFNSLGGFYRNLSYPSPSTIWIYLPTVEGLAYAIAIAWYDNSFSHSEGRISRFIALIGTYSYSIYLLHFFIVFDISSAIHTHFIDLSNIFIAMPISLACFMLMVPVGYLSYRFIELPFLRFRTRYVID